MAREVPLRSFGVLLLLTAAPAAAQRAMGDIICRCPGLAKPLGGAASCEVACGGASGGGSTGGASAIGAELGKAIGAGIAESMRKSAARKKALEEQNRRNALQREDERRAVDEARKRRLLGEMQGVESTPELTLMTEDEPARPPSTPALRVGDMELMTDEDPPVRKTPVCRVTDPCRASMAEQASAVESARAEQSDLYMAAGSGDISHGMDLAQEAIKDSGVAGRVSVYAWKTQDRFGIPQFADDYKEALDEAAELVDKETLDAGTKGMGSKAVKLKKTLESMDAFNQYMKTLLSCSKGRDKDFDLCADAAAKKFSKSLDGLPIAEASVARVKAASEAFSKYTTNALKRAMRATDAASRCLAACP